MVEGLFRLESQVTHMHLCYFRYRSIPALPTSLRHLSIVESMLMQHMSAAIPLPRLNSLSIRCSRYISVPGLNSRHVLPSLVHNLFPGITSLRLDVSWPLRNFVLAMAQSQHNLQTLELYVLTESDLVWEESQRQPSPEDIFPPEYLRAAVLPQTLATLKLEVVQTFYELERSVGCCTRWIDDNIVTGLGGPGLKSIEVWFVQPASEFVRERTLWMRWVKSHSDDWEIEKCP
jgi:hypothetical protein